MTSYDEDILDNPFYQALLEKFSDLYDVATSNGWMVSVVPGRIVNRMGCVAEVTRYLCY